MVKEEADAPEKTQEEKVQKPVKELVEKEDIIQKELVEKAEKEDIIPKENKEKLTKKEDDIPKENKEKLTKKEANNTKINLTATKIFAYFVIYSIVGYIIEMIFALLTKGVLESRKSFLYGPFCAIYGLGATTMIIGLQKFNKNNYTLFFGGVFIGAIVEYLVSWIGEMIFNIKWWDYSNMPFNINGRICLMFSIVWGILAIYLMTYFNPKIDKLLNKIPSKILKPITAILVVFLFLDWIISSFAVQMFYVRLAKQKKIELKQSNDIIEKYDKLYNENEIINKIVNTLFSDETIIKSFPNLKVTTKDGKVVLASEFFPEIKPYYLKVFTPKEKFKIEIINVQK